MEKFGGKLKIWREICEKFDFEFRGKNSTKFYKIYAPNPDFFRELLLADARRFFSRAGLSVVQPEKFSLVVNFPARNARSRKNRRDGGAAKIRFLRDFSREFFRENFIKFAKNLYKTTKKCYNENGFADFKLQFVRFQDGR